MFRKKTATSIETELLVSANKRNEEIKKYQDQENELRIALSKIKRMDDQHEILIANIKDYWKLEYLIQDALKKITDCQTYDELGNRFCLDEDFIKSINWLLKRVLTLPLVQARLLGFNELDHWFAAKKVFFKTLQECLKKDGTVQTAKGPMDEKDLHINTYKFCLVPFWDENNQLKIDSIRSQNEIKVNQTLIGNFTKSLESAIYLAENGSSEILMNLLRNIVHCFKNYLDFVDILKKAYPSAWNQQEKIGELEKKTFEIGTGKHIDDLCLMIEKMPIENLERSISLQIQKYGTESFVKDQKESKERIFAALRKRYNNSQDSLTVRNILISACNDETHELGKLMRVKRRLITAGKTRGTLRDIELFLSDPVNYEQNKFSFKYRIGGLIPNSIFDDSRRSFLMRTDVKFTDEEIYTRPRMGNFQPE